MSVNYAAGLSYYPDKGKCGQPELKEDAEQLEEKIDQLTNFIKTSKHLIVLTGAGISTSCGIPDFRGPNGVWTMEEKGKAASFSSTFETAIPSPGHLSLVALEQAGYLKYLVTQNVDGLHLRSGFPRDRLSILHGDMFIQKCDKCSHQFIRSTHSSTMGLKHTGLKCDQITKRETTCRGRLKDTILDWEDSLPNDEIEIAIQQSKEADLFLVLGSSLRILPAGNLPFYTQKSGGKFVSVNLQKTKHHNRTDLTIHYGIDKVMTSVIQKLGLTLPKFERPIVRLHSSNVNSDNVKAENVKTENGKPVEDEKPVTNGKAESLLETRRESKIKTVNKSSVKKDKKCTKEVVEYLPSLNTTVDNELLPITNMKRSGDNDIAENIDSTMKKEKFE